MSSPPDYDAENMPLIAEISDNDDAQMCKQLLRWLDENNLGNQDLISISALRDGLIKSASKLKANKTSNFGHDKKCHKHNITILELIQNFKTYLVGIFLTLVISAIQLIFLFKAPFIGIALSLSIHAALVVLFLLLATYWWGRRGPSVGGEYLEVVGQYLKVPKATAARANMEYYA
ncbi:hypothetical protein Q9L58_007988 [Maublancomyces gigas]|uniref:Uncharacterized protein n=1 Tax=Discina gigas TaxID=1032678 RepID=A0ABR3GBR9_9PEZI